MRVSSCVICCRKEDRIFAALRFSSVYCSRSSSQFSATFLERFSVFDELKFEKISNDFHSSLFIIIILRFAINLGGGVILLLQTSYFVNVVRHFGEASLVYLS